MAKTFKCKTKCFFRNRVWVVGESLVLGENENAPKHFVEASAYKKSKEELRQSADAKTLSGYNRQEQQEALRAVGHATQAAAPKNAEQAIAETAGVEAKTEQADPNQAFA